MRLFLLVYGDEINVPSAKMSERKFTRGLGKPGMAAQLRETVSQVVRESTVQVGPLTFPNRYFCRLISRINFHLIRNKFN